LYYAVIAPDFNVLPLITEHFGNRYADQRWLIFDAQRQFGAYYDLSEVEFVDFIPNEHMSGGLPLPDALDETETKYSTLWNDYFRSTNIASRKNTKLHVQHVPKRYWKYLTEKH
jgi:probable DNA metabolism protein